MTGFAHSEMLVDGAWLASHAGDANLRIVDCDGAEAYKRAHIPGAVSLPPDKGIGPLQSSFFKDPGSKDAALVMTPEQFAAAMAGLGIGNDTTVVVYDSGGSMHAARLWWCLNYYGHTDVKLLDGGWRRWLAEARPISLDETVPPHAAFTPRTNASLHASAEYLLTAYQRPDVVVLDVRSDGEWDGTNTRGNKRGGHIPGAVHLEWTNNVGDNHALKPADALRAMYEAAGVTPDKEVITVCQGGIRAAQTALTLTALGYGRVRNYDGSFREWGNRDDTPITT
jgi:thiosulfate/3-mercaptopyruvate sulfurtransferase